MTHRIRTAAALVGVTVLGLAACGSDNSSSGSSSSAATSATTTATTAAPGGSSTSSAGSGATTTAAAGTSTPSAANPTGQSLTVGSANFPENVLLAEIYAQALEAKGAKISRKLNIGNRETYYKALTGGEIDLLPEYTNSLLSYVERLKDKNANPKATNVAEQVTELKANLPDNLTVLAASTAEDKDVIACNAQTAQKYSLKTLSDLAKVADQITLGGPPEFATRSPFGVPGLKSLYGATFKDFKPLEIGTPLVDAMNANAVQCGNLFSTMSVITTNNFVALDDDKNIVPNEAVLPLIAKAKATPEVTAVLASVDSKLDTEGLKKLMVEIEQDKKAEADVATEWVKANGFKS
jgi:osmoprotectant transport system substrate-binding protein